MAAVEYVKSSQLGGIEVAIRRAPSNSPSNPTLILLHSLSTDGNLYAPQFDNVALTSAYNLIAVDLFGHGHTAGLAESVDYWDQARMVNDVIVGLGLKSTYLLGTSQGGFICARCYLLQPDLIAGIILCGTSLYSETSRLGSWDIEAILAGAIPYLSQVADDSFVLPQPFTDDVVVSGLGPNATDAQKVYCREIHERVYAKDEGRQRYLMILNTLRKRDNLSSAQLGSIAIPVLVLHGTEDGVYSVPLMREWSGELTKATGGAEIHVIEGGQHFLSASNPAELDPIVLAFLNKASVEAKL